MGEPSAAGGRKVGGRPWVRPAIAEWLVLALSGGFYATFIARSGFRAGGRTYYSLIDDSMVSMVYARNLADGHGLVWQPGQHVEGYTNFLWTLWMAVTHLLPFSERYAGVPVMVSGLAILIATMLVVRSICRVLVPNRPLVPVAAMALAGLCFPLVFWTLRGMETGLAALLLALAVRLVLDLRTEVNGRKTLALAAVLAAAVLTRDDMLLPAAVVVAFGAAWARPGARRRVLATLGGALVLVVSAHAAFRLAYYGDALPNTFYLKLGGVPIGTRLHRGLVALTYTTLTGFYVVIALAAAASACARNASRRGAVACMVAVVATEWLYSVYVGGDYAEQLGFANRFVATASPLLMVLAAIGASDLWHRAGTAGARRASLGAGVALGIGAAVLQARGWGAASTLDIHGPVSHSGSRAALAVLAVAAALAYLGLEGRRIRAALIPALAVSLLVLGLAALDYGPGRDWVRAGAADVPVERLEVARALLLRRYSSPSSSAAVVVAGDWPYFAHRRAIDLLGKADAVIAHGPNQPVVFKPGHTKWNYAYSIGKLRPDVVTGVLFPSPRDLCNLAGWGYRQIGPAFWVRNGARGIDTAGLTAGLARIDRRAKLPLPAACAPHA